MTKQEIATVLKLRRVMGPIANIVGPAYGARFCDKAIAVERALFNLALHLCDRDDVRIEHPGDMPTMRDIRVALAARAGEAAPDQTWPRGPVRCAMPPLTVREHFALGYDLKRMNDELTELCCSLGNERPRVRTEGYRRAERARRSLLRLRSALDAIVCRDFPDGYADQGSAHAYFGPARGSLRVIYGVNP
jgi:hypothetical protein